MKKLLLLTFGIWVLLFALIYFIGAMPPPSGGTPVMPVSSPTIAVNGTVKYTSLPLALSALVNDDTVEMSPGTFTVSSGQFAFTLPIATSCILSNRTNITLTGFNTTIRQTNYGTMLNLHMVSNVTIRGFTFLGDRNDVTNWIKGTGTATNFIINGGIFMTGTNFNVLIEDCKFIDMPNQGISPVVGYCDGLTVRNCRFYNLGQTNIPDRGTGIADGACLSGLWRNAVFEGNTCQRVVFGVEWDGSILSTAAAFVGQNLVIRNNRFENFWDYGIFLAPVHTNKWPTEVEMSGNYFQREAAGTNWERSDGAHWDIWLGGGSNVNLRANTHRGGNTQGQHLGALNGHSTLWGLTVDGCTFSENRNDTAPVMLYSKVLANTVCGPITLTRCRWRNPSTRALVWETPDLRLEGNTFDAWNLGTWALSAKSTSIAYAGGSASNAFISANQFSWNGHAGSYILRGDGLKLLNTRFFDNAIADGMTSNFVFYGNEYGTNVVTSLASNFLFRGSGPTHPAFPAAAGSAWFKTSLSTTGNIVLQTNSAGLPGWRSL